MKITKKIVGLGVFLVCILSVPGLGAEPLSAIDIQRGLLASEDSRVVADIGIDVSISFPDYPQVGPIVFSDDADIPYTINNSSLKLKGQDVPMLYNELEDIPSSLKPITIAIGIRDDIVRAQWNEDLDVEISNTSLVVEMYKKRMDRITRNTEPDLRFALLGLDIDVEEIDLDERYITLGFETKVPRTGNELLDELLAGKRIKGIVNIEY